MKAVPRDYQRAALDAVIAELRERVSTICDMGTGTGKTLVFAWLCVLLGGRVLILVHRDALKRQAVEKIRRVCPDVGITIEQGESRGETRRDRSLFDDEASPIVVASKDTLCRPKRLRRYRPDDFDYVIVDECHRAVKKNATYFDILKYFCRGPIGTGRAQLVGMSASLDRLDTEALGGIFQSVAFRYTLTQAIADGYLLEPKPKRVHIKGIKIAELPTRRTPDGRLEITPAALERATRKREYIAGVAAPLFELAGRTKQGVVFCSSEAQARIQLDWLNSETRGCAALCLGEPYQSGDEQREAQARLRARDVQFLVTVDLLTEGWDYDGVEIAVLKPSRSRSRVAQMAGRVTRPLDGCVDPWPSAELRKLAIACSPKPCCYLLDPCGASEEHSLVDLTDIFGGRYSSAGKPKPPGPPRGKPEDIEERRARRNALAALEAERLEGLRLEVDYEILDGDMLKSPLRKAGAVSRGHLSHPATEPQCRWLESRDFRVPPGFTKSEASAAIGSIKAREDAGPATVGQKQMLARFGLSTLVTKGEARSILERHLRAADDGAEELSQTQTA